MSPDQISENMLSVGVNVNVTHIAATPDNEEVMAVAIYRGKRGSLYKFSVELYDRGGKVGSGTHTRAIVEAQRLIKGARDRISGK